VKGLFYFVGALGLIIGLSGCGKRDYEILQSDSPVRETKKISLKEIEYKIQPHDRVSITIYQSPDLTPVNLEQKGFIVDAGGYVSLPLIHRVRVAGLTQSAAARILEKRYGAFLSDPSLTLEVLNKKIYVLGEVKTQGVIELQNDYMNIFQVLAASGGLADTARRDSIYILSYDKSMTMHMRQIDLSSFATLQGSNTIVRPNDIVYVRPNNWKPFRVAADDFTSPFEAVAKVAAPFVTIKYLSD